MRELVSHFRQALVVILAVIRVADALALYGSVDGTELSRAQCAVGQVFRGRGKIARVLLVTEVAGLL